MFATFVGQAELPWAVDSDLVEIGDTTWQTRNIASVRIQEDIANLSAQKPHFKQEKPRPNPLRYGLQFLVSLPLALFAALIGMLSIRSDHLDDAPVASAVIWIVGLGASAAFTWWTGPRAHNKRLQAWHDAKASYLEVRKLWGRLADSPPQLHSLVFDTTSGQVVALRSLDLGAVVELRDVILAAMRQGQNLPRTSGVMSVLVDSKHSATELYENYYAHKRGALQNA